MPAQNRKLVLVNLGTPEDPTPDAVRAFLAEFLSDPRVVDYPGWLWRPILERIILRVRPPRVAELYRSIWREGGAPLEVGTRRIAEGLAPLLADRCEVLWACRYGTRSLARLLPDWIDARTEEVSILPLFPQRTGSSAGSIVAEAKRLALAHGLAGRLRLLELPPDDPGYIEALAERTRRTLEAEPKPTDHLLISFHGIPARYNRKEGGVYRADCVATANALLRALGWERERATVSYQSRFGPEPWLAPATASVLAKLPRRGVRRVAVVTPGFLTDGLETVEEIGARGRQTFLDHGGKCLTLVPAVTDHPSLMASMARLVTGGETEPPRSRSNGIARGSRAGVDGGVGSRPAESVRGGAGGGGSSQPARRRKKH